MVVMTYFIFPASFSLPLCRCFSREMDGSKAWRTTVGPKPTIHPAMNPKHRSALRAGLLVCSALLGAWPFALSAQSKAPDTVGANETLDKKNETITLSPFTVTTDKDNGYGATNSISGSRVNTPIKDLPIPIQVITNDFISDIGATTLRNSLAYVSGISIQTQNDLENRA